MCCGEQKQGGGEIMRWECERGNQASRSAFETYGAVPAACDAHRASRCDWLVSASTAVWRGLAGPLHTFQPAACPRVHSSVLACCLPAFAVAVKTANDRNSAAGGA